jgi:hypothetical protein
MVLVVQERFLHFFGNSIFPAQILWYFYLHHSRVSSSMHLRALGGRWAILKLYASHYQSDLLCYLSFSRLLRIYCSPGPRRILCILSVHVQSPPNRSVPSITHPDLLCHLSSSRLPRTYHSPGPRRRPAVYAELPIYPVTTKPIYTLYTPTLYS